MMRKIKLSDSIKQKLSEAVELWADENLNGKPALLATTMYFSLEKAMIKDIEKINKLF